MNLLFFIVNIFLGLGLSMDACAVSMANGLNGDKLKTKNLLFISFMFGLFQGLMPFIGYIVGAQFVAYISFIVPWLALAILGFLGTKMIIDSVKNKNEEVTAQNLTFKVIFIQTIATSIDALSVGLTIISYTLLQAVVACLIIAVITFIICTIAHVIGKKFGYILGDKATIVGGIILIIIGLEIFITGII